ncbi:MAG: ABC transporter substrate-binding protein [Eubacteriales bacterium]|nr:ABC transporter substrate-binding protein [Eubacteriales bacterium]
MRATKLIALMLPLVLIISSAACAEQSKNTDAPETSETIVQETEGVRENVPESNFDGALYRVHVRTGGFGSEFFAEDETGDVVNDAVFKRNLAVEERFNIKFDFIQNDDETLKTIYANEDAYELIIPHARVGFADVLAGVYMDWSHLAYVDLDKPWWNQDAKTEFTIEGKLYGMIGQLSYQNLGLTFGMFFNKNLFDDYNIEYPYQSVSDGTWTFEKMAEIVVGGAKDLNGDGQINIQDDQYGYVTQLWYGPINVLYAQGGRTTAKDENNLPYLDLNTERNADIFDRYFETLNEENAFIWQGGHPQPDEIFSDGRAFFYEGDISWMSALRSSDTDFGIIPCPKYDENQDNYYTMVNAAANLFCVPVTNGDPEMTGIILEAWSAESYRVVIPAYFDVALQTKYTRDEESAEMLQLIVDCSIVDQLYYIGEINSLDCIGVQIAAGNGKNFASFYASHEKAALKSIDRIIDKFREYAY